MHLYPDIMISLVMNKTNEISLKEAQEPPPLLLGENHGINPVEYALAALNGYLTTSLIYHAAAQGIKIDEVELTLFKDLDLHGFLYSTNSKI
jgi:uncharacterized OsmC-like protein